MPYSLDLRCVEAKKAYALGANFRGVNPEGDEVGFTSCYMTKNGRPFFGVSGEMHFSRVREDEWEDSIVKAKMGGINILTTYVFWNVHEEIKGKFRFDGCRNVRRFIELCQRHGMMVIVRIGPFAHGEMRNGGLPDWLYGMPFEVRDNSQEYFFYVRRLFRELNGQFDGLYYRQGGPIVGTQIENEYMHSAAGWEITTGTSEEILNGGHDGTEHMLAIKRIAVEEGIVTPFYTCTAWGGAIAPVEEMLPLWGGYAYQPWLFHDGPGEHPLTPEYIYRRNHDNAVPATYNFEPRYAPESMPYACCEMMGGMFNSYPYRFQLPYESIDALANIKLGSGCSMLGYYMYRGGTTPAGERTPFLNEHYTPKRSYDFQAAIGENGQTRPSYFRLKRLHSFCETFADRLCLTRTVTPEYMEAMEPGDFTKLRFCARVHEDGGFVFLNNFQDHASMPEILNESVTLQLPGEEIAIRDISLVGGENAILPFNLDMGGAKLKYALAQPITHMDANGETCWFFFAPEGMKPCYAFDADTVGETDGCSGVRENGLMICRPDPQETSGFTVTTPSGTMRIVTLTARDSLRFTRIGIRGRDYAFLSDGTLLWDGETLKIETCEPEISVLAYPGDILDGLRRMENAEPENTADGMFAGWRICRAAPRREIIPRQVGPSRFVLDIPEACLCGHKRAELHADYTGDIGHLFIDGELISDNYCNGATWVSRLDDQAEALKKAPLTLYITPLRKNAKVSVNAMAARLETSDGAFVQLDRLTLVPVDDIVLPV